MTGERCPNCGTPIEVIRAAARAAHPESDPATPQSPVDLDAAIAVALADLMLVHDLMTGDVLVLRRGESIDSVTGRPLGSGHVAVSGVVRRSFEDVIAAGVAKGMTIRMASPDEAAALRAVPAEAEEGSDD